MAHRGPDPWRLLFVLGGLGIAGGGLLHPRGAGWAVLLAHPAWVPAHLTVFFGFVALAAGLMRYRRTVAPSGRTDRWALYAFYGVLTHVAELIVHTAAFVDAGHMAAGQPTPVFSTHMFLAKLLYPVFGVTMLGFIVATVREKTLASPWIAWLGLIGAGAYGSATFFAGVLNLPGAGILFPMILLFALWLVLAGLWPLPEGVATRTRRRAGSPLPTS